jgi:hypothetical protein
MKIVRGNRSIQRKLDISASKIREQTTSKKETASRMPASCWFWRGLLFNPEDAAFSFGSRGFFELNDVTIREILNIHNHHCNNITSNVSNHIYNLS